MAEVAATNKNIIPTLTEVITAGEQLQVTPYVVDFLPIINKQPYGIITALPKHM
ncbi:MAG: hypothetical protein IPP29_05565 [Bacteroidetes bacterium]|nr:hypothetical protein [Bacteroidota bacterium]